MKKLVFFALIGMIGIGGLCAQSNSSAGTVEISFTYTRQSGVGSNQFAVWITDAQGNYVKTLYATRFTATGGYAKRPQSIPDWVKQSDLASLGKEQVDAFTGPTPQAGALRYRWDGTDHAGAAVPSGEYRVFLEASIRNENRVLYSALVQLGAASGPVELAPQYFGRDTKVRAMISGVTVSFQP
ncbi:MAG: DUF2271 domain-containing protein [Treponema sp.]|jgi:hypothetical protein|nr:DUF2271 domain-containing protein [Treponema sp.]